MHVSWEINKMLRKKEHVKAMEMPGLSSDGV